MPPKGSKRDKNLDCPNVQAYRNIVHLQLNYLQRQYVVEKVSCCERGQGLWRSTLTDFMLEGKNPRNVLYMVKIWENLFWGTENAKFQEYSAKGNETQIQQHDQVC